MNCIAIMSKAKKIYSILENELNVLSKNILHLVESGKNGYYDKSQNSPALRKRQSIRHFIPLKR